MTTPTKQISSSGSAPASSLAYTRASFHLKPAEKFTEKLMPSSDMSSKPANADDHKIRKAGTGNARDQRDIDADPETSSKRFLRKLLASFAGAVLGAAFALALSWFTIEFIGGDYGLSTLILALVGGVIGSATGRLIK